MRARSVCMGVAIEIVQRVKKDMPRSLVLLAALLAVGLAPAPAQANGIALSDLLQGQTITVDDKLFADFFYQGNIDPAQIFVSPFFGPDPGLKFTSPFFETLTGNKLVILGFSVTALDTGLLIHDNTLSLTAEIENEAFADVLEVVLGDPEGVLAIKRANLLESGTATDHKTFPPHSFIGVSKVFQLANFLDEGGNPTGFVLSAEFTQTFSQTAIPEPVSLAVWSLFGAVGIGYGCWCRLRPAWYGVRVREPHPLSPG